MRTALVFYLFVGIASANAQVPALARNAVYGELGGYGIFFSLNYERTLPGPLLLRVGAAEWNVCGWTAECRHTTAFPVGVGYLLGGEVSRLLGGSDRWVEVGMGFVPGLNGSGQGAVTERDGFVSFAGTLGLRRQPGARGAMYRVALTPLLTVGAGSGFPDRGFMVYGGIALGYAF